MSAGPPWTEAEERRLRLMREAGKTQPEIAEALGRSRSSIIAKVAQLRLPRIVPVSVAHSPSPKHQPLRAGKVTLPPLASLQPPGESAPNQDPEHQAS